MIVERVDDSTIQVTKEQPTPAPIVHTYDYDFLISQRAAIIKQANDYLADRQKELDEVNALISEAEVLGITAKVMSQPIGDVIK